ncbi:phosphoacetylglucosamine mutase [Tanacetum coccineum]|uniref:Phosphoacetylglucosamine mutase n=1 Tax=Tanacetum coccineum TaxID=301880 RepID=A0ABQ5DA34_9ASTR
MTPVKEKSSLAPKSFGQEIDDIFSKKRNKPEQQNTKKSDKRTRKDSKHDEPVPRREKLSKTGGSNVDMFESEKPARPKKKTADGLVIYSEEELGFGKTDAGVLGSERGIALVCASLDGDADRFVYFTVISNGNNKINLVDGDKILSLFALFIKDQLSILIDDKDEYQPRVGHGTILFSDHFLNWLEGRKSTEKGLEKKNAAKRLWVVTKLINQVVGDALSWLLLVEAILQHMGWPVDKWNELYHDLPSRQFKCCLSNVLVLKEVSHYCLGTRMICAASVYFMLLMQDLMLPVVISYVNAAIDTTAIGFKRRSYPSDKEVYTSVLIKRFTHPVNIPKPPQNVVSSSSALANSPAFVRPSRTPTSTSPGCIFTLTSIAKWECSSYGRALALHARGTGFDSPHFLIFSLCD